MIMVFSHLISCENTMIMKNLFDHAERYLLAPRPSPRRVLTVTTCH